MPFGIPQLGAPTQFRRAAVPGAVGFDRFGEDDLAFATGALDPMRARAMAGLQAGLGEAQAGVGAASAAGGLNPAAAAALASRNRLNFGQQRVGLESAFGQQAIGLAGQAFGQNLQAAQAEQVAQFGVFDRSMAQNQFAAHFGMEQEFGRFGSELEAALAQEQIAASQAGREGFGFSDILGSVLGLGLGSFTGGLGTGFAGKLFE